MLSGPGAVVAILRSGWYGCVEQRVHGGMVTPTHAELCAADVPSAGLGSAHRGSSSGSLTEGWRFLRAGSGRSARTVLPVAQHSAAAGCGH